MTFSVWTTTLLALGVTWLQPFLRDAALAGYWLFVPLALASGVGALALAFVDPGHRRRVAVGLLFLSLWALATWMYGFEQLPYGWFAQVAHGLTLSVLPSLWAIIIGGGSSPGWRVVPQVGLLALASAPLSLVLMLVVVFLVFQHPL